MIQPVINVFEQQKRFISDSGHELKTPIAVVTANVNVLEEEIGENKWLSYISNEMQHMNSLAGQLMELSKFEEAGTQLSQACFDISRTVMGAALPFEALAYEKGIDMEYDVEPDVILTGDEEKIKKLINNILSNAVSYCNQNGQIHLTLKEHKHKIELSVYNTGKGIPEEERNLFFERFYRVDKDRERKNGHYGLGLTVVKMIAEQHHAKILVTGEYGKDVCFTFLFPSKKTKRE